MKNKKRYLKFIQVFQNERDFFGCHEILEDVWVEETKCETRKHVAINLLLISVGLLHWRNKNFKGAVQVLENSLNNYEEVSFLIEELGIDSKELKDMIQDTISKIKKQ
ncbi:MAG: DUF309 domain-containing protein, partial [Cetobacterium sp.]